MILAFCVVVLRGFFVGDFFNAFSCLVLFVGFSWGELVFSVKPSSLPGTNNY